MQTITATRRHATISSPLGELTVVADGDALVGLYFPAHTRLPDVVTFGDAIDIASPDMPDRLLADAREQLGEYFAGRRTAFDLPLAPQGDAFRQQVWALLREIPYGETRGYGDLARQLGDAHLAQAVGHANALNPISIIVPCHRVVAADGNLTGYAGGLARKRFLLDLEAPADSRLF